MSARDGGDGDKGDGGSSKPPPLSSGKQLVSESRDSDPFLNDEKSEDEEVAALVEKEKEKGKGEMVAVESTGTEINEEERIWLQSAVAPLAQFLQARTAEQSALGDTSKGKTAAEGSSGAGGSTTSKGSLRAWTADPTANLRNHPLLLDEAFIQNAARSLNMTGCNLDAPPTPPPHPPRPGAPKCFNCLEAEATTSLCHMGSHQCLCFLCLKRLEEDPSGTPCNVCKGSLDEAFMQNAATSFNMRGHNPDAPPPRHPPRPGAPKCLSCLNAEATTSLCHKGSHQCLCYPCLKRLVEEDPVVTPCKVCRRDIETSMWKEFVVPHQVAVPGAEVGLMSPTIGVGTINPTGAPDMGILSRLNLDLPAYHPDQPGDAGRCTLCESVNVTTSLYSTNPPHYCLCPPCGTKVVKEPSLTSCLTCMQESIMALWTGAGPVNPAGFTSPAVPIVSGPSFLGNAGASGMDTLSVLNLDPPTYHPDQPGSPEKCMLCLSAAATISLYPGLKHLCLCFSCVPKVHQDPGQGPCPICREEATRYL